MSRIILLKGQSNYGSLRLHIDQLHTAFKNLGYDSVVIDLVASNAYENLDNYINKPISFFFAFNGMGIDLSIEGKSLYNILNVPFVAAYVDHPHMHLGRLANKIEHHYVTMLDEGHLKFVHNYFPENHIKATKLWLPGGNRNESNPMIKHTQEEFIAKRDIQILFTGSFRGLPEKPWDSYSKSLSNLLDEVVEVILSQDIMSFEEGLSYVLETRKMFLSKKQINKLHQIMPHVNVYLHAMRRFSILNTLAKAELPVTIYGQGWDSVKTKWKSFIFKEEGTFEQTLDLLNRAKIVLNTNTCFVNGGHERVFAAMINGAAVFSDVSTYYEDNFTNNKNILLYKWTELQKAPEILNNYLHDEDALYKIASNGQTLAIEQHSWEERAKSLIEFIEINENLYGIEEI